LGEGKGRGGGDRERGRIKKSQRKIIRIMDRTQMEERKDTDNVEQNRYEIEEDKE